MNYNDDILFEDEPEINWDDESQMNYPVYGPQTLLELIEMQEDYAYDAYYCGHGYCDHEYCDHKYDHEIESSIIRLKQLYLKQLEEELIAAAMHPSRIMKQMEHYSDVEEFFDNF